MNHTNAHPDTIVVKARQTAIACHGEQLYANAFPYYVHLLQVEGVMVRTDITDIELLAAANLHDVLEDTECLPSLIRGTFGERIYRMVEAVTEPRGLNRKERHAATYPKIRANGLDAVALKLADRIANVEFGGKFGMYQREHDNFRENIYISESCLVRTPEEDRLKGWVLQMQQHLDVTMNKAAR